MGSGGGSASSYDTHHEVFGQGAAGGRGGGKLRIKDVCCLQFMRFIESKNVYNLVLAAVFLLK